MCPALDQPLGFEFIHKGHQPTGNGSKSGCQGLLADRRCRGQDSENPSMRGRQICFREALCEFCRRMGAHRRHRTRQRRLGVSESGRGPAVIAWRWAEARASAGGAACPDARPSDGALDDEAGVGGGILVGDLNHRVVVEPLERAPRTERVAPVGARHQRPLTTALERARAIALLPYTTETH